MPARTICHLSRFALLCGLICIFALNVSADDWKGEVSSWKGFQRYDFQVDGLDCYVVVPMKPATGNPWIWRATFPEYHTEADVMTNQHGLAGKVALEAVSRGGLFAYRWAAQHPERVACIYADVPVCDIKSWPLGQGTGLGNKKTWERLLKEYGFTEEQALEWRENPIDVLEPIAAARIPLLNIVSLNDRVIPPKENTFLLAEQYRELGGSIEIIEVPEGSNENGHHLVHPDPERVASFIEKHSR
jgi:sialidase-1